MMARYFFRRRVRPKKMPEQILGAKVEVDGSGDTIYNTLFMSRPVLPLEATHDPSRCKGRQSKTTSQLTFEEPVTVPGGENFTGRIEFRYSGKRRTNF